jgi:CRP-like cAMP-binding protein
MSKLPVKQQQLPESPLLKLIRQKSRKNSNSNGGRINFNQGDKSFNSILHDDVTPLELLVEILLKPPHFRTPGDMILLIRYLNSSELMNKFKKEKLNETAYNNLMYGCAMNLHCKLAKSNEFIFKIDEYPDKFYLILKGSVKVLKPITKVTKMNFSEYYDFLMTLHKNNDLHLLLKTLQANVGVNFLPIFDIKTLEDRKKQIFEKRITDYLKINTEVGNANLQEVCKIFTLYGINWDEYNLDYPQLERMYIKHRDVSNRNLIKVDENHNFQNPTEKDNLDLNDFLDHHNKWFEYLKDKIYSTINQDEEERIMSTITSNNEKEFANAEVKKKDITIYIYQEIITIKEGHYFGDFALDNLISKKRTATIQAVENSVLAFISNDVYEEYIFQEKYKIKLKEIAFLNEQFFFYPIKTSVFEKKYFQHFILNEYTRGMNLYTANHPLDQIYFIKEGYVDLVFKGSIIELHKLSNLIKELLMNKLKYHVERSSYVSALIDKLFEGQKHIFTKEDKRFDTLKYKDKEFVKYVTQIRNFQLFRFTDKETFGLKEIFLETEKCCFSAICTTEKVVAYSLERNKLLNIINDDKNVFNPFVKASLVKVLNILKRIHHIKNTLVEVYQNNSGQSNINTLKKEEEPRIPIHLNSHSVLRNEEKSLKKLIKNKIKSDKLENEVNNMRSGHVPFEKVVIKKFETLFNSCKLPLLNDKVVDDITEINNSNNRYESPIRMRKLSKTNSMGTIMDRRDVEKFKTISSKAVGLVTKNENEEKLLKSRINKKNKFRSASMHVTVHSDSKNKNNLHLGLTKLNLIGKNLHNTIHQQSARDMSCLNYSELYSTISINNKFNKTQLSSPKMYNNANENESIINMSEKFQYNQDKFQVKKFTTSTIKQFYKNLTKKKFLSNTSIF